ncbi:Uncharacterized protein BM_BM14239 [Brugia malayi]|uniref:Bm14239 n=1 Tax=Brugia malayi TaxID=6279 RepID=A0A0K0J0M2_BRUMA|nr:Uncharacterized protein BM_BM14239 [Brugia malayi]CDP98028.1 Bm14239 [Brugia malayi]VIO93802.1 Uncharacterized protein BM_BM14239 [Brugia malayi]
MISSLNIGNPKYDKNLDLFSEPELCHFKYNKMCKMDEMDEEEWSDRSLEINSSSNSVG